MLNIVFKYPIIFRFEKAGQGADYPQMGKLACERALHDAKISYQDIKTVVAGYNYGDPTCGKSLFVACLLINLERRIENFFAAESLRPI